MKDFPGRPTRGLLENLNFAIFAFTYAEFDAGHENGLLLGIWRLWKT